MKKVIIALFAVSVLWACTPVQAATDEDCETLRGVAEALQDMHQSGIPLFRTLERIDGYRGLSIEGTKRLRNLALDAYRQPRRSGSAAKRKEVENFGETIYSICISTD